MSVWVMDELPVQLLRLLGVKLLAAFWALERARHLDAHIGRGSMARLGGIADLHRLGHDAYDKSLQEAAARCVQSP